MPFRMTLMIIVPMITPRIFPLPPIRLTPPTTVAAIESSSSPPAVTVDAHPQRPIIIRPASAARKPEITYTENRMFFTRIPDSQALTELPPTA